MKNPSLDKKLLRTLYVEKKKTAYEISELLQIKQEVVINSLKENNIDHSPKLRKYRLVRKAPLTREQKEAIIGMVLGGGRIVSHGSRKKTYHLETSNLEKDKDLILYKKGTLGNLCNLIREEEKKDKKFLKLITANHQELKWYSDLFYNNHKKVIKENLLYHVSPRSVAFWAMDKSYMRTEDNQFWMRFSTYEFSKEEHKLLQAMLKINFNIRSKVCEYKWKGKVCNYLSLNKRNTLLMAELTEPFYKEANRYIVHLDPQRLECQSSENKNSE